MKKIKKREIFHTLLLVLVIFPFVSLSSVIKNEDILRALMVFSAAILTFLTFRESTSLFINPPLVTLFLLSLYLLMISIYHSTLTYGILFSIYFPCISSLYILVNLKKKNYTFFIALYYIFNLSILLNFPSIISSINLPEYKKVFFLVGKNAVTLLCISTLFYNELYIYTFKKKKNIFNRLMTLLTFLTMFLSGSSTAIIVGVVLIVFFLKPKMIKINLKLYISLYLILIVLVFNSDYISQIPIVNDFITQTLNKNLSFTGRTNIWEKVIQYININPYGYGKGNSVISSFTETNEAHNAFLELILTGGYPSLMLFITFLFNVFKSTHRVKNNYLFEFSKFILFCFFVLGLTESIIYNINLWWVLIIVYGMNKYYVLAS